MNDGVGESVGQALDDYLTENGFTIAEYSAKMVTLYAGPFSMRFPNFESRQKIVPLHDLHHVVTGFGTDVIGEAEIGIWELRAGCPSPIGILLNGSAAFFGLFLSPRRVIRAFLAAKGAKTLYVSSISADAAKQMSVEELRRQLGVPESGVAIPTERRLHSHAPQISIA